MQTACTVGKGTGEAIGTLSLEDCDKDNEPYELDPDFFSAEAIEDQLEIRIQHGSDLAVYSDGLSIFVKKVTEVHNELLGMPIPVSQETESLVNASLYLNKTCESERNRNEDALIIYATSGTITFFNIYGSEIEDSENLIEADFDLFFSDPSSEELRQASLKGNFSFRYIRGRPAQRFP